MKLQNYTTAGLVKHTLLVKMAKDSLYVVGPVNLLEGLLNNPNFNNRGEVRYSLDNTQILLEEEESKFSTVVDKIPLITTMTESERQGKGQQ